MENPTSPHTDVKGKILNSYRDYILTNGHEPPSIYAFCKELEISEDEFYEHFNSFEQISDAIWSDLFNQVVQKVEEEKEFSEYAVREKLLSFYYEFFIQMKKYRSYAMITIGDGLANLGGTPSGFGEMKKEFKTWIKELIEEGMRLGQIADRSKLTEAYDTLFWFQFLFLLNFWKRDKSVGFEKTDAAVEKSVVLTFDLIEKNALDSAFDFGKFIFQNK